MSFHKWVQAGWLKPHRTSKQEIADLFGVADRDIAACQTAGLIADWRLNIAYNAALQLATAALAAAGYQPACWAPLPRDSVTRLDAANRRGHDCRVR